MVTPSSIWAAGCETEGSDLLLIDEGKMQNVSAMFQYDII